MIKPVIRRFLSNLKKKLLFRTDFNRFAQISKAVPPRFRLVWGDRYPCFDDRTGTTPFDRHYVFHTAWAARIMAQTRPQYHVDIASSLYFSALVSAFIPIRFYDYRPADLKLSHLDSGVANLTSLPFPDKSVSSLSCMHVIEHIGLGRYGDPLDPNGDLKAMRELGRVLAPSGNLLFVVPVGKPGICFNAHRIYDSDQIIESFPDLVLQELTLIPDNSEDGDLIFNPDRALLRKQSYGCGCFWFKRKP